MIVPSRPASGSVVCPAELDVLLLRHRRATPTTPRTKRVEHPLVEQLGTVEGEHEGVADEAAVAQRVDPSGRDGRHLRILQERVGGGLLARQRLPVGRARRR